MKSFSVCFDSDRNSATLTTAYDDEGAALGKFLATIINELLAARIKFPSSECSMVALTEEVGELAKAMLDESEERILKESAQVATMAIRVALEGDISIEDYRKNRRQ